MSIAISGLAKRLVIDGLLTETQAKEALRLARDDKIPFVTHLVKHKIADSGRIAMAASEEFGAPLLDLDFPEDSGCDTDMNVVMTGAGGFVEVQGTAEGEPFARSQMDSLLGLAERGIRELILRQRQALDLR